MKKKNVLISLLLIFCMVLCTACGSDGKTDAASDNGNGIKIMLTLSDASDTFRASLADAAKSAAEKAGMTIDVKDAAGSSETQMNQIKEAEDADVIICALCDSGTAQQMEALAGDKPIVFINSCPEEDYLEADRYVFVGSDEAVAGNLQAQYVLNKYASKSELNIAIIKGESTHSATKGRTKAVKAALNASGKKINYVFEDYADWSTDVAENMFDLLLKTDQSVDAVICNNDSMAIGIVQSADKHKMDFSSLPILGVDATKDGLASIKEGKLACTIYQPAVGQGEAAIKAAIRLVQGKSITSLEGAEDNGLYMWVPFEQVTADNVSKYE